MKHSKLSANSEAMPTLKRRRHPRVPEFPPLEELAPGSPFNPYALFEGWSIRKAIAGAPKLRAGAKLVWLILADQVYSSDYDSHSERTLATLVSVSVRQFRRYLRALGKAKLVHVAPDIGRQNYTWLLWHPLFAYCSPLPPVRSVRGVRTEVSVGSGQEWPTQRNVQRNYQRMGSADDRNGTSNRTTPDWNGGREGEILESAPEGPPLAITSSRSTRVRPSSERTRNTPSSDAAQSETIAVAKDARAFWYALEPAVKRNRWEQAARAHGRITHFRQFLKDSDAVIQRQAQYEMASALAELNGLGFTLHSHGKGTR
jgi:hypothetical protein